MAAGSVGQAKSRPNTPSNEGGETGGVHLSDQLVQLGLDASYQIEGLVEMMLDEIEKNSLLGVSKDVDACSDDALRSISMRIRTLNDALMAILGDDLVRANPREIARDVIGHRAARRVFADAPRRGAAGADRE